MKFAEHLIAHITPEWRKQYIHYEVTLSCYNFNSLISKLYIKIFNLGDESNAVCRRRTGTIRRACGTGNTYTILC